MSCRTAAATNVVFLLTLACSGCRSVGGNWLAGMKQQYTQAVEGMKADMAVLDSDDDGLNAFAPGDAKHLRAARADMER